MKAKKRVKIMKKKDEIEENGNEGNNEDEKDNESKVK
jgi:hypothetical protein